MNKNENKTTDNELIIIPMIGMAKGRFHHRSHNSAQLFLLRAPQIKRLLQRRCFGHVTEKRAGDRPLSLRAAFINYHSASSSFIDLFIPIFPRR